MEPEGTYLDQYKIIRTLGSGYSATVLLGETPDHVLVAIKRFKPATANLQTLKHELSVMKQLNHINIVNLIDVRQNAIFKKPDGTSYDCFAIILEYMEGGELFDIIAIAGRFNEMMTRTYFLQLIDAVNYMHERGFAHRDIKPENVMLTKNYVLKLADYGFATLLEGKDKSGYLSTRLGTEGYMAPEIATKKYQGQKVDIFACGVILFIMFSGIPPFQKATLFDPYYKLIKQKDFKRFWLVHGKRKPLNFYKQDFKRLIESMLAFDPAQRPTLAQIRQNFEWIKGQTVSLQNLKTELDERKKKVDEEHQNQRRQKQKRRQQRQKALNRIDKQSIKQNSDTQIFVQNYDKQQCKKQCLQTKKHIQNCDIVVHQTPQFVCSTILTFLSKDLIVKDGEITLQQYHPTYQRQGNNFIITFEFKNNEQKPQKFKMSLTITKDKQGNVVITPKKLQGMCIHARRIKQLFNNEFSYCKINK